MSDIGMQLERLKSPNVYVRHEACEELRTAESLPEEAIRALEVAANDQDALVANAARRALLTHRPPTDRELAEMAVHEYAPEHCPVCGGHEFAIDKRSGGDLARSLSDPRVGRYFLIWLGACALIFLQFLGSEKSSIKVFVVVALLGFVWMLITIIRVHRQAYDASRAVRSFARYTCEACGHQWTVQGSRGTSARASGEARAATGMASQETEGVVPAAAPIDAPARWSPRPTGDVPTEPTIFTPMKWTPIVISFGLALLLNTLVILGVAQLVYGGFLGGSYLILCLPVSALILALCAWVGAQIAKNSGAGRERGAVMGIWIGAIASIALSLLGLLGIGPGV